MEVEVSQGYGDVLAKSVLGMKHNDSVTPISELPATHDPQTSYPSPSEASTTESQRKPS